ncbi:hypothetical protein Acr_11g0011850 [Actinidia rufa]|uniref:Uncharacterized protein n=1 Tax=Actinidia rufa TaxID=165716 RepID=A0A7J0FFB6_9ERIC|nr:hypothetical protein Acr_11g0011850 [Actinidia rufa]
MSRDGGKNSSLSWEITKSLPMDYLGILELRGFRGCGAPQIEQERFDQISNTLEQGQFYPIKDILHSKSFLRSFALDFKKMGSNCRDNAEEKPTCHVVHVAADEGESSLFRGDPPEKMDLRKLAQLAKRRGEPKGVTLAGAKDIIICEKCTRDETLDILPSKKVKQAADTKRRGPCRRLMTKKGPIIKAQAKSKATSSHATTNEVPTSAALGEGTSANLGFVLGLEAFTMENSAVVEKLLQRLILLADKEAMDKMDFDKVITRFLQSLSQAMVLGSSLIDRGREMRDEAMTQ